MDMQDLAPWNDNYRYVLVVIDAFTKFTWIRALKNKTAANVAVNFAHLLDNEGLSCIVLYTDSGTEFLGDPFQRLLRQRNIAHRICAGEEFHCAFVERMNRTLKEKIYQAMTREVSRRWLDLLPRIVATYNKTIHSTTGTRPIEVNDHNSLDVYNKMYHRSQKKKTKTKTKKFASGDYVRIVKIPQAFNRGYLPNFTWEVFRVIAPVATYENDAPTAYFLEDLKGQPIRPGIFYEPELSRVDKSLIDSPSKTAWPIREILRKRKKGKEEEVLVWWQGFPRAQAEWIPTNRLVQKL